MPKLKLGAAVYALIAILQGVSAVLILRQFGPYAEVSGWPLTATAIVVALAGVLFAVGAVTRRGLVGDDGPWICRDGWMVVVGLAAAAFLISLMIDDGVGSPFPLGPAVFVPHWVRRMQEQYHQGIAEGEREVVVRAAERGGERPPAS